MSRRQTTGLGLTPSRAFIGLLDHGLFSEKIPPCFSSAGLSEYVPARLNSLCKTTSSQELSELLEGTCHDYVRYDVFRPTNIPRQFGIPHPESHAAQCLAIKRHWDKIKRHCATPRVPVSRLFVRRRRGRRVFKINYKGRERIVDEEADLERRIGARYLVRADIANFFPSIYSHSIPWALHGHDKAKSERSILCEGNLLDKVTRNTRDGQTNGLLIGPHTSNVMAELVLARIDRELVKCHGRYKRHIDDYEYAAKTYAEAERFVRHLSLLLRQYDLTINDQKTKILPLPIPSEAEWKRELNALWSLEHQKAVRYHTVRRFMDLALTLAQREGDYAILNYAIKMVRPGLKQRTRRLFVEEVVHLTLLYPYLASILDEYVFVRHHYAGIEKAIATLARALLKLGVERIQTDAIVHALHFMLKYDLKWDGREVEDTLGEVVDIGDCLSQVLAREYARRHRMTRIRNRVRRGTDRIKELGRREGDRQWLLVYQVWREKTLREQGQEFLADLKKQRFAFLRLVQVR